MIADGKEGLNKKKPIRNPDGQTRRILRSFGHHLYMGGCQNYGPFLGPWYNTAPTIHGTQKGAKNFDNYPYYGILFYD